MSQGPEAIEHWLKRKTLIPFRRFPVSHGEHAASTKDGDLVSVDLVVFGFAALDGLHVKGVTQDKGYILLCAQISEPIPGRDALHGHHDILPIRAMALRKNAEAEGVFLRKTLSRSWFRTQTYMVVA